jgi:predicted RNA-binding Zn-ribbon protein involved in translation (DUF1610 family)
MWKNSREERKMTRQCPKCKNTTINDSYKFCHKDGTVMEDLKKCTTCNNSLLDHFEYCPKCGERVIVEAECPTS